MSGPASLQPDRGITAGRILALDLGKRRIGMAVSDALGLTAQGLDTLERTRLREDLARIGEIAGTLGATRILIGNPIHMSGQEGRGSAWARDFAAQLEERTGYPVELWDERLTTSEAQRVLKGSGISIEKRSAAVDRLAAVLLLESYLEAHRSDDGDLT